MQYSEIMVRYGELSTKGKNRMRFINKLKHNMKHVLSIYPDVRVVADRDRAHIYLNGTDYVSVAESLKQIFGIQGFSPSYKVEKNLETIKKAVQDVMKDVYHEGLTFKITSKRSDHNFEMDSRELNQYLNKLLRQDAQILREAIAAGADDKAVQAKKEALLQEVFNFLAINLGLPPRTIDFAYRDKDNNYHSDKNITPQEFFKKYVGLDLSEYVSVINAPTADKPYGKSYTVEMLGNVVGSREVRYLNLDMERFKELAIAQMQAGETVWFGSDVGQISDRQKGIMATNVYDFETAMDINFTQDKAGRLDYSESLMTHAMVLTGVDLDENGKSLKWKVENSWGDKVGNKGYFVASDAWMDEFTYQIVVRKEFLTAEERAAYEAEPIVLAPWDPMGALASK